MRSSRDILKESKLMDELKKGKIGKEVWNISKVEKVTLRDAAFILSVKKIAKAVELRGIFP